MGCQMKNWIWNLCCDSTFHRNSSFPNGVVDHMFSHGTFPRGYSDKESKFSKADRDRNRAKSKVARKSMRSTRSHDKTQN